MKRFRGNGDLFLLVVALVLGTLLRFWNIHLLDLFTYDQARDALYVKRLIVDHEWRLLGPQGSLPGSYLPPFYYYTLVPVLWVAGLSPVGIDIYTAFLGVLTILFLFIIGNRMLGKPAGSLAALFFAVSPITVEFTRRAWSTSTLPFFILIVLYFTYRYLKGGSKKDLLLMFLFLGYCLNLSFSVLSLLPLVFLIWLHFIIYRKDYLVGLACWLIILLFFLPLALFELRHNFVMIQQIKASIFSGPEVTLSWFALPGSVLAFFLFLFSVLFSGRVWPGVTNPPEFQGKLAELFSFGQPFLVVAQKPLAISFQWWGLLMALGVIFLIIKLCLSRSWFKLNLSPVLLFGWILTGILFANFYGGKFFFYYYLPLFPAVFLLSGFLLKQLWGYSFLRPLVGVLAFWTVFYNLQVTHVFSPGWRSIGDLREVGKIISENVGEENFNLATIQKYNYRWDRNAVDYRYFVETDGGKKTGGWYPEDYQNARVLFVIDETGGASVLEDKFMETAAFRPKGILNKWDLSGGRILYELTK